MPVNVRQLMTEVAPMGEHTSIDFDVLKNIGVHTTMANVLKWQDDLNVAASIKDLVSAPTFEATRSLSKLIEPSALDALRGAEEYMKEIFASARVVEQFSALNSAQIFAVQDLTRLANTSRLIRSQFSAIEGCVASVALQRATVLGIRGWQSAATAFVERPDAKRFLPLEAFGRGTVGLTSAVTVLLPPQFDDNTTDVDDDLGLLGPASFAEALRESLRSLDHRLPRRLDGAWERVSRRGPDAASQAAHSLMETIDWTLRLAAPDAAVLVWHAAEGRSDKELHNGKPTRRLQVEFLLRRRPAEAHAARLHLRALGDLVRVLESHKHSADEADIEAVARLIPTVEGLLVFVLGISLY
jgi:Predicted pPIWI-associating nuclease